MGGSGVLNFYQNNEWQNYHFAYINAKKNFIINNSDLLLEGSSTTMFAQNQIFTIHLQNNPCSQPTLPTNNIVDSVNNFLSTNYPKQKLLPLVFEPLIKKNFISDNFYFTNHENVHIIDFIRWINNRFDKNEKPPPQLKMLIKNLQAEKIRIPTACVQNPIAKRLLLC